MTLGTKSPILVLPDQSEALGPRLIVVLKNTWLLKLSATRITVFRLIFGPWECSSISCYLLSPHSRAMTWRPKSIGDAVIRISVCRPLSQKNKNLKKSLPKSKIFSEKSLLLIPKKECSFQTSKTILYSANFPSKSRTPQIFTKTTKKKRNTSKMKSRLTNTAWTVKWSHKTNPERIWSRKNKSAQGPNICKGNSRKSFSKSKKSNT
jgi:hypothetical protein